MKMKLATPMCQGVWQLLCRAEQIRLLRGLSGATFPDVSSKNSSLDLVEILP